MIRSGGKKTAGTCRVKLIHFCHSINNEKLRRPDFLPDCYQSLMSVIYPRVCLLMKCSNLVVTIYSY